VAGAVVAAVAPVGADMAVVAPVVAGAVVPPEDGAGDDAPGAPATGGTGLGFGAYLACNAVNNAKTNRQIASAIVVRRSMAP
jgi:hypothetical protein